MSVERIEADYLVETAYDVRKAVEIMAGEQSSGTFVPVPGETPELKARSAARVENLEMLGEADQPSLPGSGAPRESGKRLRARATLSWPLDNIGPSLPNLMRLSPAVCSSSNNSRVCALSTCACRTPLRALIRGPNSASRALAS